jgi:hypothetical protein
MANFAEMNATYEKFFTHKPAWLEAVVNSVVWKRPRSKLTNQGQWWLTIVITEN